MKSFFAVLLGITMLGAGADAAMAKTKSSITPVMWRIQLSPRNGSKIDGVATIVLHGLKRPASAVVTIKLNGVFIPEASYPAAIYAGPCRDSYRQLPVVRLNPVQGGQSRTEIGGIPSANRWPVAPRASFSIAVLRSHIPITIVCGEMARP